METKRIISISDSVTVGASVEAERLGFSVLVAAD
jgi:hypothetical protein